MNFRVSGTNTHTLNFGTVRMFDRVDWTLNRGMSYYRCVVSLALPIEQDPQLDPIQLFFEDFDKSQHFKFPSFFSGPILRLAQFVLSRASPLLLLIC